MTNPASTALSPNKSRRILVVDDLALNMIFLGKVLRRLGFRPEGVSNGVEALEKMKTVKYDLIFMDCSMPQMNGYETTRLIRDASDSDDQPVIIALTGDIMNAHRQKCLDAGMNDFMSKPYTPEQIESILKKWLPESLTGETSDRSH